MGSNERNANQGEVNSKVARLIEKYELRNYGDRLEELWTTDTEERESLRSLADRFNKRLLESRMNEEGMSTVDGEVSNTYRLLSNDDVSSGNQVEVQRRLEQNGINIEQLETDFVTYQAIRSYLKDYRGANYDWSSSERSKTVIETIQRLKSRTRSVTEQNIDQLKNTNRITLGSFRTFTDISILCEDCDTQYEVVDLVQNGGCECQNE